MPILLKQETKGADVPKYVLLSIPILLAVLVGLIAYAIRLESLDIPTQAEIDAAPSWEETYQQYRKQGARPSLNEDRLKEALRRMNENAPLEPSAPGTAEPRQPSDSRRDRSVVMDAKATWREKLEKERHNKVLAARKTGVLAGLFGLLAGYIGLGLYFYRLGHQKPKQSWQDALTQQQAASAPAVSHKTPVTYEEPAPEAAPQAPVEETAPQPPQEPVLDDETPYEPYEAPVDISEIEQAYEEQQPPDDTQPRQEG